MLLLYDILDAVRAPVRRPAEFADTEIAGGIDTEFLDIRRESVCRCEIPSTPIKRNMPFISA